MTNESKKVPKKRSKTARTEGGGTYKIQVLDRTIALLNVLSAHAAEMSLVELTAELKLHKSTVHRLAAVLEGYDLVQKSAATGKYSLGLKLFELGTKAVAGLNIRDRAHQQLERLAFETGETVHLCVVDNGEMLYIDKVEPARSVRLASSVGRRIKMHCSGVGKAVLAHWNEATVEDVIRRHGMPEQTRHTISSLAQLTKELDRVRERGYAMDNEENEEGVRCIAAAVRDFTGKVIAAISISGPTFRVTEKNVPTLAAVVMKIADEISRLLGAPDVLVAKAGR